VVVFVFSRRNLRPRFGVAIVFKPCILLAASVIAATATAMPALNESVESGVQDLIERDEARAVVVGLYADGKRRVIPYGWMSRDRKQAPDGNTLFEIGSSARSQKPPERGRNRTIDKPASRRAFSQTGTISVE
jgi:hypothetical protein